MVILIGMFNVGKTQCDSNYAIMFQLQIASVLHCYIVTSSTCSASSFTTSEPSVFFLTDAAALAKLNDGRTLAAGGLRGASPFGDVGAVEVGDVVLRGSPRWEAVREEVRDIA